MILSLDRVKIYHQPVMVKEVVVALQVRPGGRYIDCTVGEGGHAEAILEASAPDGQLLGIDADPEAIRIAEQRLEPYRDAFQPVNANFVDLLRVTASHAFLPVDGILMDLGLSSLQLEGEDRGFSFRRDESLDMRFNPDQPRTAREIVNSSSEEELVRIVIRYGEEPVARARRIARVIVENRPINTSLELARLIERVAPRGKSRIHPATRTFQALRIEVNEELRNLELGLQQAISLLRQGGRLAVISYHSLEDRLVKNLFRREATDCICPPKRPVCACGHKASIRLVNRRVITPAPEEVLVNPRSRSARMRVVEYL